MNNMKGSVLAKFLPVSRQEHQQRKWLLRKVVNSRWCKACKNIALIVDLQAKNLEMAKVKSAYIDAS